MGKNDSVNFCNFCNFFKHSYPEAIELINNNLKVLNSIGTVEQITKYILTQIIIHLGKDDWVSAKNCLDSAQKKLEFLNT